MFVLGFGLVVGVFHCFVFICLSSKFKEKKKAGEQRQNPISGTRVEKYTQGKEGGEWVWQIKVGGHLR